MDEPYGFRATSFWKAFRASSSAGAGARRIGAGASSVRMSGDSGRLLNPCLRSLNGGLSLLTGICEWFRESTGRERSSTAAVP